MANVSQETLKFSPMRLDETLLRKGLRNLLNKHIMAKNSNKNIRPEFGHGIVAYNVRFTMQDLMKIQVLLDRNTAEVEKLVHGFENGIAAKAVPATYAVHMILARIVDQTIGSVDATGELDLFNEEHKEEAE